MTHDKLPSSETMTLERRDFIEAERLKFEGHCADGEAVRDGDGYLDRILDDMWYGWLCCVNDSAEHREREGCDIAPDGWRCKREKGHEGPCATEPTVMHVPSPKDRPNNPHKRGYAGAGTIASQLHKTESVNGSVLINCWELNVQL